RRGGGVGDGFAAKTTAHPEGEVLAGGGPPRAQREPGIAARVRAAGDPPRAHRHRPVAISPTGPAWCAWRYLLELEETDGVVVRVGEPGREREPDVGDAIDGAQLGEVLDLHAPRPQLRDLAGDVVHP